MGQRSQEHTQDHDLLGVLMAIIYYSRRFKSKISKGMWHMG